MFWAFFLILVARQFVFAFVVQQEIDMPQEILTKFELDHA